MDGPPPQEEDFSTIPISDRIAHKNWKARVSAYESLIKTFQTTASDTDPAFKPYINNSELLKKLVTDSNAVAQEKGVECVVALVKYAGETAAKTRDTVVPALVDKCFGSSRAGTKNQAIELVLQYAEVENGGAGVVGDILPGLGAKQPKAVAGCVTALKEIVRVFGTQVTPPAPVLKALPKIFSHNDKTVRAEGTLLTQSLYQFIGPGIEPWLVDLKPLQVKELKEGFESLESSGKGKGSIKPARMTRAQAREAEVAEVNGVDETGAQEEEDLTPPDPRTLAEPVEIGSKLSSSLHSALTSSKWKERKEALDDLLTLLSSTPRIKDSSEMSELVKALAVRVQGDANINCVMTAANCIEALTKGMMGSFARYRETSVALMLERLKERKANVTDAIGAALDAVFATTTLSDILSEILPALGSKNPQAKEGTLKFFGRCLSSATSPIPAQQIKPVSEQLASLLEDGFEGARTEAATCMGTLMKMVGERPMNAVMEGIADMRKAKVKEAFEKATVKCKAGGAPKAASSAPSKDALPKKGVSKAIAEQDEPPAPKKLAPKAPAKAPTKKPPTSSSAPPAAAKKAAAAQPSSSAPKSSKGGSAPAPGTLDSFKYKHTPEDAETLASELLPNAIMTDLGDANWKTRLAGLEEMTSWIEGAVDELDAEVVIRALAKKGWGEKNFQVSAKIYGILVILAERCPSFGRSCAALCVPHLSEKLGDIKLKKPAGDALLKFAEKTSLQFVLNQAYEPLSKAKAPKVLADAIAWADSALTDFGIAGLSLRSLIEFLKTGLKNSNAAVRTSATKALVTLKLFAGSSIKDFLEDLNPQLLNTINSEFDKVEGTPAPIPSRFSVDLANVATSSAASGPGAASAGDPLDELFPRVEIDNLIKGSSILADSKSDAWKVKKEALEALQATLDLGPNKRLKPNMGEIGQVLKARVTDTNKSVQTLALDIVSRIAVGMGKAFEKHTRFFALPVATVLSDQKAPIRASAIQTLTSMATACEGLDSMVQGLGTALESSNPLQKGSLLHWISEWFKEHERTPGLDLNAWASVIVSSLDDRNPEVRKGAQAMLPTLIACSGFDYVMQQTSSLKPASRTSAVPLIQAARSAAPTAAPTVLIPAKSAAQVPPASVSAVSENSPPPTPLPVTKGAPQSKLVGVRRKLPLGTGRSESRAETAAEIAQIPSGQGNGPSKPAGLSASKGPPAFATDSLPFVGMSLDAKKARLAKDANKWVNEGGSTRKDLAELLQHQMEPHASKELISRLFSHDHHAVNDHIQGITMMCDLFCRPEPGDEYEDIRTVCMANFDLSLKYASLKAHEPQPNLISKCIDLVETVLAFLRTFDCQLTDTEALCFIPTMIYKLGDAREQVRVRVQNLIQTLPKVYAYSRVFQILLDHGLKSKVAKTRQGALDEMGSLLKRFGLATCEPSKALPVVASMIADKDSQVRKSALSALSEAYSLVGEKIWSLVGPLSAKDKTQLEERLRRVPGPSQPEKQEPITQVSRFNGRAGSPALTSKFGGIPRPASPVVTGISKLARPASPARPLQSGPPAMANIPPTSPKHSTRPPISPFSGPPSPTGRPRSLMPSRLGRPRTGPTPRTPVNDAQAIETPIQARQTSNIAQQAGPSPSEIQVLDGDNPQSSEDITIIISSILSNDPSRSVDALKKIQRILAVGPDAGPSSPQYRELAEHTEGLIETITLQMAHVFDRPDDLVPDENFRLAKHLIQTLNNFCDHAFLAESLTVDILTSLLEELTLRLLDTDDSHVKKVKDLSRFINMIILRLFATGRRMSVFRALFALLLQIVKPFPSNGTSPDSKESKVAELVLKCVWKLARNIPQDLNEHHLDPVELFPAIENFLQSIPPNEWRARATSKVPCGDMPLRTIKVIIQHVVAHYGDDVYDLLSASFDDPSATIVYPYVYRILNSSSRVTADVPPQQNGLTRDPASRPFSQASSRPISPQETASSAASASHHHSSPSHRTSPSASSLNGHGAFSPTVEEPDPDAQLLTIIGHISSETTGALHKEGITELHHFLKAYPHKKPRVDKMLESTGAAFRKYIQRALASRAAEDAERNVAVADTLSKLESNHPDTTITPREEPSPQTVQRASQSNQEKLSRLHDIFHYRSSTASNGSSHGRTTPSAISPVPQ